MVALPIITAYTHVKRIVTGETNAYTLLGRHSVPMPDIGKSTPCLRQCETTLDSTAAGKTHGYLIVCLMLEAVCSVFNECYWSLGDDFKDAEFLRQVSLSQELRVCWSRALPDSFDRGWRLMCRLKGQDTQAESAGRSCGDDETTTTWQLILVMAHKSVQRDTHLVQLGHLRYLQESCKKLIFDGFSKS